jgi:MFS family permease
LAAPTPLYARYAERWGFSALATTVVFGVYALTVLAGLLTFGRLSDHVGRRPVLLAGLALQAVAMVVFATAGGAFNGAEPRPALYLSIAALVTGVAVTLAAVSADSAAGFFIGTAIAGVGFGGGFQGGIRLVLPLLGEQERAGVLSLLYIVSYLGLGAPAVIAGVLVTEVNGLLEVAREYGVAVIVLAGLALAGLLLTRKAESPVHEASGVAYVDAGDGTWAVQGDADDDVPVPGRLEEQALPCGAGVAGLDADRARIAAD